MHITIDKGSPDFWRLHFKGSMQVRLNGAYVEHAIEADDIEGWVIVHWRENDRFVIDGDTFAAKRLDGAVEFLGERRERPLTVMFRPR